MLEAQQFGQLAGVNLVTLAALFQQSILTRITHQHFRDMRLQQVIQPGCPGSFFEGDMQISAQTVDELQNRVRFRLDNALHHDLALSVPYRNRNRLLVNIHPDILRVQHRVLLPVGDDPNTQNLLQKGRPFIMRALTKNRFAAQTTATARKSTMANPFRTSNPALNEKAFRGEVTLGGEAMTLQGTVNKTGLLLLCVVAPSAWTLGLSQSPAPGAPTPWVIGGVPGGVGDPA